MKHTPSRIVWATLGTLLTVAFVGWGAFNVTVLLAHGQHTEVHRFEASAVQRLIVSSDAGRITVRAAEVDTVTVTARVSTSIGRTGHHETLHDGTLDLGSGCPNFSTWCSVAYTVVVPARVAVDVTSGDGSVHIQGIEAPVHVRSDNGHVELVRLTGTIQVGTDNGYVVGRGLRATVVDAATDNGHLDLDFAAPVHRVRARSDNGWVEVHVPDRPGAYRVTASTDNGSRDVAVQTDPNGGDTIDVSSDNGHVRVDYRTP
jgi:DUF4097 and DUF4098 domain-containing protein YvlB